MEEKIKISLQKTVCDLLKRDCKDFKIKKENGEPNMNAFINGLLINYYEEFSASQEELHNEIRKVLVRIPDCYKEDVFHDIVKVISNRCDDKSEHKNSVSLSFKPTKNSEKAVLYIEKVLLQSESLSSFYRRLFTAYSQKPKNEREKIIHKTNFELLQKAIKKSVKVCIALQSGDFIENASIFSVSPAKDELFNYVLLFDGKHNVTMRLASIKCISLLSEKSEIPDSNKDLFERQVSCAPQYPMYNSDKAPIKVMLTDKGKKLFDKIYLYRPTPISIDGDVYTFNCSANQLIYYFERFGDNALILSPKRIGIFMRNYYYYAYKKYNSIYYKDN